MWTPALESLEIQSKEMKGIMRCYSFVPRMNSSSFIGTEILRQSNQACSSHLSFRLLLSGRLSYLEKEEVEKGIWKLHVSCGGCDSWRWIQSVHNRNDADRRIVRSSHYNAHVPEFSWILMDEMVMDGSLVADSRIGTRSVPGMNSYRSMSHALVTTELYQSKRIQVFKNMYYEAQKSVGWDANIVNSLQSYAERILILM